MAKPPRPLFAGFAAPPATEPTWVGVDMGGESLSAEAMVGGADSVIDWWDVGNAICNALTDARTIDDIERIKAGHAGALKAMVAARRDIAETVSQAFQLRRQELGAK